MSTSNTNNDYVAFIHWIKLTNLLQSKKNAMQEDKIIFFLFPEYRSWSPSPGTCFTVQICSSRYSSYTYICRVNPLNNLIPMTILGRRNSVHWDDIINYRSIGRLWFHYGGMWLLPEWCSWKAQDDRRCSMSADNGARYLSHCLAPDVLNMLQHLIPCPSSH